MIFHHDFSSILFAAGPLEIRWYGLFYALGLGLVYTIAYFIFKKQKYPIAHLDSVVLYLFVGMLVGARLGHVFFYEATYYLAHPVEILKVWNGGLASHGGAIGVLVAYAIWCKLHRVKFSKYVDALVIGVPILAGLIRIGNFFNSEIVGNKTDGSFGVVFERLGESFPRHPVQIYAALISWATFVVLLIAYKKYYKKTPPLFFLFLYLLLYFSGRFVVEYWKDLHGPIEQLPIAMGQLLSLPGIIISLAYFIFFAKKLKSRKA
jgi:phosphatidylglycerol---prolipoprotein diacylglyceryl transferase